MSWQLLVGCRIRIYDEDQVDQWATTELASETNPDNWSDLAELIGLNAFDADVPPALVRVVDKQFPDFVITSSEALEFSKQLWFVFLERYVAGHGLPDDVGCVVAEIEWMFDFPAWLGKMYDACDCAPNDRSLSPYVFLEAKAILDRFS